MEIIVQGKFNDILKNVIEDVQRKMRRLKMVGSFVLENNFKVNKVRKDFKFT